ncbi:FecR domain-containing protein [Dysgonomonas sp. Marseille-P4677]|uniref:FecR family protein n=1 Tax=Dysgonomonas sp. Marseille-P4677 TaxID=2364790 RepID=UPI0019140845|nr:FecR domain-containing protein [Dysgonomonas sp. Marseille-P4677]MBK5722827.1 FecR domain-containing protein [Dysgonomonas sp. Marseille-P4677]
MDKDKCLDIFERYILKQASTEDVASLCSFINNDPHLNKWLENQIMSSSSEVDVDVKMRMLDNIRSQVEYSIEGEMEISPNLSGRRYIRWVANIAAILLPIAILVGVYIYNKPQKIDYLTVSAGLGEKASINLPDGSKVAINSESEIIYNTSYNKNDRFLKLRGEAYFDVESDQYKPFIVECGDIKVKVLGTTFGISAYDNDNTISVVLNTGNVELITPSETVTMKPNDRVVYDKSTKITNKEQVDAKDYIEWRQNRLRFQSETLENIIRVISRMHNIDISFMDAQLAKQKFTGTIDNTSVQSALKALSLTAPISYEVKDSVIFLYENKEQVQHFR